MLEFRRRTPQVPRPWYQFGPNVFCGLYRVSVPDLHTPDMLHTVYLGLFKHMMDWIQAFLKKHGRLQAVDDVWKALPRTLDFWYPKKPTVRLRSGKGRR